MEKLTSWRDALLFLLKGLYDAEKEINDMLDNFNKHASTLSVKHKLATYQSNQPKILETFKQIFNYLNETLQERTNIIIRDILIETRERLNGENNKIEKDALIIRTIININEYKICDYRACLHFATLLGETEVERLIEELLQNVLQLNSELNLLETLIPENSGPRLATA